MVIKKSLGVVGNQMEICISYSRHLHDSLPLRPTILYSMWMFFIVMWVKYPVVSEMGLFTMQVTGRKSLNN